MDGLFPEGTYQPIPIVWFTAAVVGQTVVLAILYMVFTVLLQVPAIVVIAIAVVWTLYLFYRIWPRKMARASFLWRTVFLGALIAQFAFFTYGVINGPACEDVYEFPEVKCKNGISETAMSATVKVHKRKRGSVLFTGG